METLNEASQWTNASQVDSFVTLRTHMGEWLSAHLCRNSQCSITRKVCFRFQTLGTHFQLLNLTTLFSSSIFCFLSLCFCSSTHFHHFFQHCLTSITVSPFSLTPPCLRLITIILHSACSSSTSTYLSPSLLHFILYLTLHGLWCHIDSQSHS